MTIPQLHARLNALKRKYAPPLLILLRRRPKNQPQPLRHNPNPTPPNPPKRPAVPNNELVPARPLTRVPDRPAPQNGAKWGEKSTKFPPLAPQKAATPKAKAQPNGWKWGEMGGNKKIPAPGNPNRRQPNPDPEM